MKYLKHGKINSNPLWTVSMSMSLPSTPSSMDPTVKRLSSHLDSSRAESVPSRRWMSSAIVRVLKCVSRVMRSKQWVDIDRRQRWCCRSLNGQAARVASTSSEVAQRRGSPCHHPSGERHSLPPRNNDCLCTGCPDSGTSIQEIRKSNRG